MAYKREFLYFQYGYSRRLQQFHFTVYNIMITAFSILLQLHGILLIPLMNQKREQQTILNEILCDRRQTIRKIKRQNEKISIKKRTCWYKAGRTDLWWEYFVSGVTPEEFWKKNFSLEEASLFDHVSQLRS